MSEAAGLAILLPVKAISYQTPVWSILGAAALIWAGSIARARAATEARFDDYLTEVWQVTEGLPGNSVTAVAQTPDGYLWVGTHSGPARFDGVRFEVFDGNTRGPENDRIRKLFVARQGGMPISRRWAREIEANPELLRESVTCATEDSSGHFWVGTAKSKLFRFGTNGPPLVFSAQSGFPPGQISDVMEDKEGNVWVASLGSGLIRLKRAVFQSFGLAEGLPPEPVISLAEESPGRLLLGTLEGGMFVMENGRCFGPVALPGMPISVWALQAGRSGGIWAGTHGEGLLKFHGQKSAQWTMRDGLVDQKISALHEDRAGGLWIGTDSGLSRFDGQRFVHYSTADGLSDNAVQAITQDETGDLWFGTAAGLNRFRSGKFASFFRKDGLGSDHVRSLLAGTGGALWVGTADGGLSRFNGGRFVNYSVNQGLPDNSIRVILDDGLGYLWLGTGRGICRVAHSELDAVAQGLRPRMECVTYLKEDGLPSIQCSAGNPSGIRACDGRLCFATAGGVSVADPRRIRANTVPPPVVIEAVSLDGAVVLSNRHTGGAEIAPFMVPPGRRHLEFAYTALTFTSPARTRFRIQMEGLDQGWHDFGTRRVAYYTGLPPGDYRFRVIAANSDGVWSDPGAALRFTVLPTFWQTWWFRGGTGAGFTGVALFLFRRRILLSETKLAQRKIQLLEQHKVLEAERSRIARDMHDEMGASLTKITLLGAAAELEMFSPDEGERQRAKSRLQRISALGRSLVASMDEIVWAVNPGNDSLEGFADYLCHFCPEFLKLAEILCRLEVPEVLPKRILHSQARHHLFLTVKEALHNVIQHSGAAHVALTLEIQSNTLSITIADDGRGFDAREGGRPGNGLANMRHRMKQIAGEIEMTSQPGHGTRITLRAPFAAC